MKKALKNLQNLKKLFKEHGTAELDLVGMNIGYDGKVYFLFSSGIPARIDGMFVNTVANAVHGNGSHAFLAERRRGECGKIRSW